MSFVSKLRLKSDEDFLLLNAPVHLQADFAGWKHSGQCADLDAWPQVLCFVAGRSELMIVVDQILARLAPDALFWLAYPKKSGSIPSDLSRDESWECLSVHGFQAVMQVSLDKDWSALRFRRPEQMRAYQRAVPMEERQTEGIDYLNRKVQLPEDARQVLMQVPDLLPVFEQLSFTHQREWVESIVTARKPETRIRRIEKMVASLRGKQSSKARPSK
jgi:hypothetical protein